MLNQEQVNYVTKVLGAPFESLTPDEQKYAIKIKAGIVKQKLIPRLATLDTMSDHEREELFAFVSQSVDMLRNDVKRAHQTPDIQGISKLIGTLDIILADLRTHMDLRIMAKEMSR